MVEVDEKTTLKKLRIVTKAKFKQQIQFQKVADQKYLIFNQSHPSFTPELCFDWLFDQKDEKFVGSFLKKNLVLLFEFCFIS